MNPPSPADFSLAQPGGAGTDIQITVTLPPPAPALTYRIKIYDNGVLQVDGFSNASPESMGVFPAGHTASAQIAWAGAGGAPLLSEFTLIKSIVAA